MTQPLLVRLPNHLGDTVMTLPALHRLRAGGRDLSLIGQPWAQALLEASGWRVYELPRDKREHVAVFKRAAALAGTRELLLLTNSFSTALQARAAGLRSTGYARDARRLLLSRAVSVPARWARDMHTVEYYDALAAACLDAPEQAPGELSLPLSTRARTAAAGLLAAAGLHRPFVMLCPGATGKHRGRDKTWPGFTQLCRELLATGHRPVAMPNAGEQERFSALLPGATILPSADVATFAAVLAAAELVVANDSGPSHLAAAVHARSLIVFGVTEPVRTRPWSSDALIVGDERGWPAFEDVRSLAFRTLGAAAASIC